MDISKKRAMVRYSTLGGGVYPLDHPKMEHRARPPWHMVNLPEHAWPRRTREAIAERTAALAQRAVWDKKADEWFRGRAQHAHAVAAHPDHGADVAQAGASFAANAAAPAPAAE